MNLYNTTLGELYTALNPLEIKQLTAYLHEKPNDKVKKLHQWYVKLAKEQKLKDYNAEYLMEKVMGKDRPVYSSYTTLTNLLANHIKEFLLLSKIREKNIYTETLWGEILIERRLARNLLLKLTNFKFSLFHDSYSMMKLFYHKREHFFYQFINLTRKNYKTLIHTQFEQIKSFENYFNFYMLELYSSLVSYLKQNNEIHLVNKGDIYELTSKNMGSEIDLIKIQTHTLLMLYETNIDSYYCLRDMLFKKYNQFSHVTQVQLVPTLLNFGYYQIFKGTEDFEEENYKLLVFLEKSKILFSQGVFSVLRLFTYIRLELTFGNLEKAEKLLEESLNQISPAQKDSFQYLIESRIYFAKQDYKLSLRKIITVNPSDLTYYYPQYKIMLIKCHIMLADIDRLVAERENFYKYIQSHKNIPEDEKRRHKLYIKYSEYLTQARYDYLTDYMKRRIDQALLQTSPYFTEKPWVRERWEYLKKTSEE